MSAPEYIVKQKWQTRHYFWAGLGAVLALILLILLGYVLGNRHSLQLITQNEQLLALSDTQQKSIESLESELIMQQQINQVEQATNAEAGQSMEQQQRTIRELERELGFYRSILAPEESAKGLQVSQFQWQQLETDKVKWQISLLQAGSTGRVLSGLASFSLIYDDNGTETKEPILTSSNNTDFGFRFRYFQNISGELNLAPGRQPVAFEVEARQYGQGQQPITRRFPWNPPQEPNTDVE